MRFESKKAMAQALIDGRRFKDTSGDQIFYDANVGGSPFRLQFEGDKGSVNAWGVWDHFDYDWTEILPWYENIPEHGVLCWVWDGWEDDRVLRVVVSRSAGHRPFRSLGGAHWKNARPITPEEAQKYIYQEPEK